MPEFCPYRPGVLTDSISQQLIQGMPSDAPLTGADTDEVLWRGLRTIEAAITGICRRYGKLLLIYMTRAVVAPDQFNINIRDAVGNAQALQILKTAALKYGKDLVELRFGAVPAGSYVPYTLAEVEDSCRLLELGSYFYYFVGLWRQNGEGTVLGIRDGHIKVWNPDDRIAQLNTFQNARRERWQNMYAPSAALETLEEVRPSVGSEAPFVFQCGPLHRRDATVPIEALDVSFPGMHPGRQFRAHYLWHPHQLTESLDRIRLYSDFVMQEFGLTPEVLLACLARIAAACAAEQFNNPSALQQALLTGGMLMPRQALSRILSATTSSPETTEILKPNTETVARLVDVLVLTDHEARQLDLHDNWVPKMIYAIGNDDVFVDWTSTHFFLNDLLWKPSSQDRTREIKSARFVSELDHWVSQRSKRSSALFGTE